MFLREAISIADSVEIETEGSTISIKANVDGHVVTGFNVTLQSVMKECVTVEELEGIIGESYPDALISEQWMCTGPIDDDGMSRELANETQARFLKRIR